MLNLLEKVTGARGTDVIVSPESVLFVVAKGNLGRAIGKAGANIHKFQGLLGKPVEIVEGGESVSELVSNALAPAKLVSVEENHKGDKVEVIVSVDPKSKGLAIGRNGERIKRARLLAKRFFGVEEVRIV